MQRSIHLPFDLLASAFLPMLNARFVRSGKTLGIILVYVLFSARGSAMPLAHSVAEFSATQGKDGWHYGWGFSGDLTDFHLFPYVQAAQAGHNYEMWALGPVPPHQWLQVSAVDQDAGFADSITGGTGFIDSKRRWISDYSGLISITGDVGSNAFYSSVPVPEWADGMLAFIVIDGVRHDITPGGYLSHRHNDPENWVAYSLTADVTVGTVIDFVVRVHGLEYWDFARFTAEINTVSTPVPEGGGTLPLLAMAAGLCRGLRSHRRLISGLAGYCRSGFHFRIAPSLLRSHETAAENRRSNRTAREIASIMALSLLSFLSACAPPPEEVFQAVKTDDNRILQKHLRRARDINPSLGYPYNVPLLIHAINRGRHTFATELIAKGADVNAPGEYGITALITAVGGLETGDNLEFIGALLSAGANINAQQSSGLLKGQSAIHALLSKHGMRGEPDAKFPSLNSPPVTISYKNEPTEAELLQALNFLLKAGPDLSLQNADGYTPIEQAELLGWEEAVAALKEAGSPPMRAEVVALGRVDWSGVSAAGWKAGGARGEWQARLRQRVPPEYAIKEEAGDYFWRSQESAVVYARKLKDAQAEALTKFYNAFRRNYEASYTRSAAEVEAAQRPAF